MQIKNSEMTCSNEHNGLLQPFNVSLQSFACTINSDLNKKGFFFSWKHWKPLSQVRGHPIIQGTNSNLWRQRCASWVGSGFLFSPKSEPKWRCRIGKISISKPRTQGITPDRNCWNTADYKYQINQQQGEGRPCLYTQEGRETIRHRWDA